MLDIGRKIRAQREARGLSRRAFSEEIGIPEAKVQALEIGKQRTDHVTLAEISRFFGVSADWFLESSEVSDAATGFSDAPASSFGGPSAASGFAVIPRFDAAQIVAGAQLSAETAKGHVALSHDWLARRDQDAANLAAVTVSGDSMEPRLSDGDLAIFDRTDAEMRDGVSYVFRLGDDLLIKRLQILPLNHVKLCSLNTDFEPILVHLDSNELTALGRVIASIHEW